VTTFIAWMNALPDMLVYLALAGGAAIENVVPAVPADTFVALGGFLAGAGDLDARWVAAVTWLANVTSALIVFRLSRAHGPTFFRSRWGEALVRPHQMERMGRFYQRWGLPAIFFSRFLPGVRAVVPIFAGATRQPGWRVVPPIAIASAIWYGGLVWLGLWAGQNLATLSETLGRLKTVLAVAAGIVIVLVAIWWVATRRAPNE
jgi:membrane protein DedA with SNARE-associated domain